jgi:tRNA A-37 threonylcarbamoyl transferase component Bud32
LSSSFDHADVAAFGSATVPTVVRASPARTARPASAPRPYDALAPALDAADRPPWPRGKIEWHIVPGWAEKLLRAGEMPMDDWLTRGAAQVVKHGSHRTVYRVAIAGRAFFVKHYRITKSPEALKHLVRATSARREWRNALELDRRGVPSIVPIGFGECRRGGLVRDSFFLTEELPGATTLEQFTDELLPAGGAASQRHLRRVLVDAVARFCASLHAAGVFHRDLHRGNLLIAADRDRAAKEAGDQRSSSRSGSGATAAGRSAQSACRGQESSPARAAADIMGEQTSLVLVDLPAIRFSESLPWKATRDSLVMIAASWLGHASTAERRRFWRAYLAARPDLQLSDPRVAAEEIEQRALEAYRRNIRQRDKRYLRDNKDYCRLSQSRRLAHAVVGLKREEARRLVDDPELPFRIARAVAAEEAERGAEASQQTPERRTLREDAQRIAATVEVGYGDHERVLELPSKHGTAKAAPSIAPLGPAVAGEVPGDRVRITLLVNGEATEAEYRRIAEPRHWWHAWRFAFGASLRAWFNGCALAARGIAVARPLWACQATLEERNVGYLASEFHTGEPLNVYLRKFDSAARDCPAADGRADWRRIVRELGGLVGQLHAWGITHSRLVSSSFQVVSETRSAAEKSTERTVLLRDIGPVRFHRSLSERVRAAEVAKLLADVSVCHALSRADCSRFLKAYNRQFAASCSQEEGETGSAWDAPEIDSAHLAPISVASPPHSGHEMPGQPHLMERAGTEALLRPARRSPRQGPSSGGEQGWPGDSSTS